MIPSRAGQNGKEAVCCRRWLLNDNVLLILLKVLFFTLSFSFCLHNQGSDRRSRCRRAPQAAVVSLEKDKQKKIKNKRVAPTIQRNAERGRAVLCACVEIVDDPIYVHSSSSPNFVSGATLPLALASILDRFYLCSLT